MKFRSKEIRWFIDEPDVSIIQWFESLNLTFSSVKSRTDSYLLIPDRDDIGIKLREGNIEIKQRLGEPVEYDLGDRAQGYLEDFWTKWSFKIAINDTLAESIIKEKDEDWIEINKKRLGVKITVQPNGEWAIHDISKKLDAGCQLEYTKIKVRGEVWYTFAVEWFGNKDIELEKDKMLNIIGNTYLKTKDSYPYSKFLLKFIK